MSHAATMLEPYPAELHVDRRLVAGAIDAALECLGRPVDGAPVA
jgi:hypothetical protein